MKLRIIDEDQQEDRDLNFRTFEKKSKETERIAGSDGDSASSASPEEDEEDINIIKLIRSQLPPLSPGVAVRRVRPKP